MRLGHLPMDERSCLRVIQHSIQEIPAHWTDWAALDGLRSGRNRTSEHWIALGGRGEGSHNP